LDALPDAEAAALLESCCGAAEWVRRMLARRPFGTREALFAAAEETWWSLAPSDWHEAFAHHPRIGERTAAAAQPPRARGWSADEQRGVSTSPESVRAALAAGNEEYERLFGHIYLVCAAGRNAEEMLALLRQRLSNDAKTELRVAAGEQAKITGLRLGKLFDGSQGVPK
jgi:2-oxo-4-hydroxy-4-carboxy-5-ureidoimidazoline decarboxylase